jgi:uncharacterized protein YyaL (SSP411 family)
MPNRLIDETSPYLLQHAHNPVDWYPWGPEALERAKQEDKPILLSVGYSACHWCHVMERESFENDDIAALMNTHFVSIKVDREERPDIDSIYMSAVQALSGQGGWPMTVFLTPDGKPFYGGTYFPPEDRGGLPGFPRLLETLAGIYRDKREDIAQTTENLMRRMEQMTPVSDGFEPLTADIIGAAFVVLAGNHDDKHGGFGLQPKFPQPMVQEALLRHYLRTGDFGALEMVELTLDKMARGGIYDQIGGGFHRYSTDTFWLAPHFEKMLYDNALLARLYLHAYQATGKPLYRRIVEETLDYVLREMTDESGGFYSTQDADSEGEEGKFFIWRPEEILEVLGKEDGERFNAYYDVTINGNFEGHSILNVKNPDSEMELLLSRDRAKLYEAREARVKPDRDEKILTAWNGLMMAAFAEAGAALERQDYTEAAAANARFLKKEVRDGDRLLRTYKDGSARLKGYLEDYSFLIEGLLVLHEATFDGEWLQEAVALGHAMVLLFWDAPSGQFYDTGTDHEELVMRPRDVQDNAIPSGSSMAATVLLKLALVTGDGDLDRRAVESLRPMRELMERYPTGAGQWLCALDFYVSSPKEIAIVGEPGSSDTSGLLREVFHSYIPNRVLVGRRPADETIAGLPLAEGRSMLGGKATAYVCRNYTCEFPVSAPDALAKQLAG